MGDGSEGQQSNVTSLLSMPSLDFLNPFAARPTPTPASTPTQNLKDVDPRMITRPGNVDPGMIRQPDILQLLKVDDRTDLNRDIESSFYGGGAQQATPTPTPSATPKRWLWDV
jgi:hypothetical protein